MENNILFNIMIFVVDGVHDEFYQQLSVAQKLPVTGLNWGRWCQKQLSMPYMIIHIPQDIVRYIYFSCPCACFWHQTSNMASIYKQSQMYPTHIPLKPSQF